VSRVASSKIRRYFDPRTLFDIPKFFIGFFQLLWKVFWFMPDVLFSKGGPGALAAVLVCRFYRIPVIIHESDSIPGLTTKISSYFSQRIAASFASVRNYLKGDIAVVGNPIRRFLLSPGMTQEDAKRTFGFNSARPIILFIGGSQGAVRINDFVLDVFEDLIKDFQVIHQTGIKNFDALQKELRVITKNYAEEEKNRYKPFSYLEENLKSAFLAADIVISRAGSLSIFEIAYFEKPSILIPLPEAANNHQVKNAYEYAGTGAAVVIESANLTPNIFMSQLKKLISNPEVMKSMSAAAKNFYKPKAAKTIAEEILNLGNRE
ncbi:UDP-N-acetylglucosamine--N-acetylmuramyl-(pentapeptide) pyrophosphoryl-undecaprenol N-acetylglucosamine transferase, partial [Candidatus Wolfebacteria bacterium]|nr:UDP-N-acetylglucosamine--N-acetylmuramyl-(pentapeptide) pyrophosphoryl-undecaprenol N-acetylglucosamine transferase [Candidatus Wolfebacteria bacterium]